MVDGVRERRQKRNPVPDAHLELKLQEAGAYIFTSLRRILDTTKTSVGIYHDQLEPFLCIILFKHCDLRLVFTTCYGMKSCLRAGVLNVEHGLLECA